MGEKGRRGMQRGGEGRGDMLREREGRSGGGDFLLEVVGGVVA